MHWSMLKWSQLKRKRNGPIEKRYWLNATGSVFQELIAQLARRMFPNTDSQCTTAENELDLPRVRRQAFQSRNTTRKKVHSMLQKGQSNSSSSERMSSTSIRAFAGYPSESKKLPAENPQLQQRSRFCIDGSQHLSTPGRGPYCFRIHGQV